MKKITFIMALLLLSCGKKAELTTPVEKSITESIYASGNIESKDQYTAFVAASGIVKSIFLSAGDKVEAGSPILSLSTVAQELSKDNAALAASFSDLSANQGRLTEAKQMIDLAKAKMQNDSIQYARQKILKDKNIGAAVEFEMAQLAYQNSKTSYTSVKENYVQLKRQLDLNSKQAKNNLKLAISSQSDYTLKSNMKGELYAVNVEVGEVVSPQTPIGIIGSGDAFVLKMQVDEYDISQVRLGQKVIVSLDTERNKSFEAKITKIYPLMNAQSKTFLVEAEFVTRPERIFPNVSIEANIILKTKEKALLIPREYLIDEDKVLTENGKTVRVKTGLKDFKYVEILSGISAKQKLQKPQE